MSGGIPGEGICTFDLFYFQPQIAAIWWILEDVAGVNFQLFGHRGGGGGDLKKLRACTENDLCRTIQNIILLCSSVMILKYIII